MISFLSVVLDYKYTVCNTYLVSMRSSNYIKYLIAEIDTKGKYLGTLFDNKLRWDDNTGIIVKKCQQRLYFLRKVNSISVDKTI